VTLRIFNTLSKQEEEFKPLDDDKVKMYVCGVTVYDDMHMGHARSVIVFDMIVRYLRSRGYQVEHLTNFTDVDDKIIDRAAEKGMEPLELSSMYIERYFEDVDRLGGPPRRRLPKSIGEHRCHHRDDRKESSRTAWLPERGRQRGTSRSEKGQGTMAA